MYWIVDLKPINIGHLRLDSHLPLMPYANVPLNERGLINYGVVHGYIYVRKDEFDIDEERGIDIYNQFMRRLKEIKVKSDNEIKLANWLAFQLDRNVDISIPTIVDEIVAGILENEYESNTSTEEPAASKNKKTTQKKKEKDYKKKMKDNKKKKRGG